RLYYTPDADALSYDANGGAGSMPPAEGVVGQEVAVAESAFSKQGYVFAGWNTKTDGSGRVYAPGDVYVLTAGEDKVFAQWEEGVAAYRVEHYKVSADHAQASRFSVDEDEGVTGSSASATARNVPGYTYQPLFDENGMRTVSSGTVAADGSLVLRLYYTPDADALSYDANGGTGATRATEGVVDQEVIVAESAFEKPGYGFTGWNTQADGAGAPYAAGEAYLLTVGEDRLFAQWTALDGTPYAVEHYKVAPDGASASLAYRDRKTGVTDAAAKAVPMDFSRDGYTYAPGFAGDGMVEAVEGTIAADGSLVLRLYYTPDADALSYDANGGAGSMPPAEGVVGQEVAVAESAFIRDGFSFAGWNTVPDGSGAAYAPGDGFALSVGEDRLFAQWVVDAVVDPEDFVLYVGGAHPDEGGSGAFPRALLSVALADGSEMDAVRWYVNGELFEPTEAAPHPFAIEYYDEDGNKVSGKPGDDAPGDYAVRIANAGDVQVEGGDGVRHAVRAEEGRYRVRDATEAKKVHAAVGSESEVDGTEAAVLIPEGSTILVNGRPELGGPTEGGVSLLFDDLLTQERADRLSAKADATTSLEDPSGMQLKYLDLVDALNGNVWLSSSEGCTVFWPYPEGTDEHDEFELVHFPGLNREDLDDGLMDAVVPELVRIEKTPVGLKFHVPEGRFSPFALVWQKAAAEPDPPVEPESPVSPDPDLPIGSEPEAPKDLPASEAFPTPKALVKTGDGFPAAVAVVAGVALLAAALAGLRMRRDRRER
ncbi:InlB B-repeat-containing protein, partial [Eggerthella guodeyinii]